MTQEDGTIVGFVVARALEPDWEIENIAVAANSRRRGLGKRLLSALLNRAREDGASTIFLEVRESNDEARAFYERLQFVENGRRSRYYRDPVEDAVVYRLALK